MARLGIALSGGGFRATLYHLGVIRFLRDAGALEDVTHIASVSGGSILAAHLALNWDRYTGDDKSFAEAADQIVRFVQLDVRNHIVRRLPIQIPMRVLAKAGVLTYRNHTPNAILERYYKQHLYGDRCLYELPQQPMLHILTTSVSNGTLSAFNRSGLFVQRREGEASRKLQHIPGTMASIARVVGASSAFPGFFPPVEMTAADLGVREGQFPTEFFTDGGVFDNLGLRAFLWLKRNESNFDRVLVSDAGKPFQILSDAALGVFGQSMRATDILWDRVWQLERENFAREEGFAFLPMTKTVDLADDPTAQHPVVQAEVLSIRTDLDRFSDEEVNALVRHGYEVARNECRRNRLLDDRVIPDSAPWAPIATALPPEIAAEATRLGGPTPATQLSRNLRGSSRRRVWTTLFDWHDWTSYLYLIIAFLVVFYLPYQYYELYRQSQKQQQIISAITQGDRDIRQVLRLAESHPTASWTSENVTEKPTPTPSNFDGIEILSHTRIYDLRWWHPDEPTPEQHGYVYVRDQITLQKLDSYQGDGIITFRFHSKIEDVEFRQPNEELRGTIYRISDPVGMRSGTRTLFEFQYNLSQLPPEEPVTIELEMIGDSPKSTRAPFVTQAKTDLINVWILFPEDRPYRTYGLVSYPSDQSERPELMRSRYAIDHPYGSLIGWSVVNPSQDRVYECRWTYE